MNGIGERASNCSTEEVIVAIKVRKDIMNVHTRINHNEIGVPARPSIICNARSHNQGDCRYRRISRTLPVSTRGWRTEKPQKLRNRGPRNRSVLNRVQLNRPPAPAVRQ